MDRLIAGIAAGAGLFGLVGGLVWDARTARQRSAFELTDEHLRHRRELDVRDRAHPLTGHRRPAPAHLVAAALSSEIQRGAFRAAALSDDRGPIAQVVDDGPAPALMGNLVDGVRHLAGRVAHRCGEPTTLRLTTPGGESVVWGPGPRGTTLVDVPLARLRCRALVSTISTRRHRIVMPVRVI